jgi:hypothetical protein
VGVNSSTVLCSLCVHVYGRSLAYSRLALPCLVCQNLNQATGGKRIQLWYRTAVADDYDSMDDFEASWLTNIHISKNNR